MASTLTLQMPVVVGRRIPELDTLKGVASILVALRHIGGPSWKSS